MATTTDIHTFASISNVDLKDLIDAVDYNNTKKQIKYGINRLDSKIWTVPFHSASLREMEHKLYCDNQMDGVGLLLTSLFNNNNRH